MSRTAPYSPISPLRGALTPRSAVGPARHTRAPDPGRTPTPLISLQRYASAPAFTLDGMAHIWYEPGYLKARMEGVTYTLAPGGGGATSPLTTKGDIWGYSTLDARIAVGANDTFLVGDSTVALGVAYKALTAGTAIGVSGRTIAHATGSNGDLHTDYAFLTGRAGGQTLSGGTAANEVLTLQGTSHATVTTARIDVTGADLKMATAGRGIMDSGGTKRIALATASPHGVFTGDLRITSGVMSINRAPSSAVSLWIKNGTTDGACGLIVDMNQASGAPPGVTGISGNASQGGHAYASGGLYGLYFQMIVSCPSAEAGGIVQAANCLVATLYNNNSGAAGNNTIVQSAYYDTLSAVINTQTGLSITLFQGLHLADPVVGASIVTFRGIQIDALSANPTTSYQPLYIDGVASTSDNFGSRHRMNLQLGSLTAAWGTADGVLGFANVTTAPSTTPASGIVLYAANAQRLIMRGVYAVNETVHTTLTMLAAGTAYASSTTETALNNAVFNFPANSLVAGAIYRVTARGIYSDTLTPTFQWRVRWGGVAGVLLGDSGAVVLGVSQTNLGWHVEFLIRVVSIGATGTVECQGEAAANTTAILASADHMSNTAVITIDTTAAKDLVLTGTWSANSASNTLACRQFLVERIG